MRNKKNETPNISPERGESSVHIRREPAAIIFFALAVLLAFLLWAPENLSGLLGKGIRPLFLGLGGQTMLLLPFFLIYLGFELLIGKYHAEASTRRACIFFLLLCLTALVGLFSMDFSKVGGKASATETLLLFWHSGLSPDLISSNGLSGGLLGNLMAYSLAVLSGYTGAMIIYISMFIALCGLAFNLSYGAFIRRTADALRSSGERLNSMGRELYTRRRELRELGDNANPTWSVDEALSNTNENSQMDTDTRRPELPNRFDFPLTESEDNAETKTPSASATGQVKPLSQDTILESRPCAYPERKVETDPSNQHIENYSRPNVRRVDLTVNTDAKTVIPEKQAQSPTNITNPAIGAQTASKDSTDVAPELETRAAAIQEDKTSVQDKSKRETWPDRATAKATVTPPTKSTERVSASTQNSAKGKESPQQLSMMSKYVPPSPELLTASPPKVRTEQDVKRIQLLGAKLEKTLNDFGVDAKVVNFVSGPTISRFELTPGPGVKVSKIVGLSDDIALALAAVGVRIEAPIPGKSAIGVEIPNKDMDAVLLRDLIETKVFKESSSGLTSVLGRDIQGGEILCDLSKMPHLLIAGATGSGKSVCINSILISLLYKSSPDDLRLIMVDPKVVELSIYNGIPHLWCPVVTDPKKAPATLNFAVNEMTRRYDLFAKYSVRDFKAYNQLIQDGHIEDGSKLPLVLVVIDELSDLMATAPAEVETAIARLTAMARAAGIHLIIATQRPSVDVITGVIKANIPSRIAFSVASQVDSRTILDMVGAEKLLGKGDMLYYPQSASKPLRGQGAFVSDAEVERVISYLKNLYPVNYNTELIRAIDIAGSADAKKDGQEEGGALDELLDEALRIVIEAGYAAVSLLQRRLNIGYPRAARIIDQLHEQHYIGPFEGSKPRKVLITRDEYQSHKADQAAEES